MRRRPAGAPGSRTEGRDPRHPAVAVAIGDSDTVRRRDGVVPGQDGTTGVAVAPIELLVTAGHDVERLVVITEEDMQTVLFDAAVRTPATCALAAETPSPLIDGDALEPVGP